MLKQWVPAVKPEKEELEKRLDAALEFFYHSQVYQLIREGVSDMHCMSDEYLAEELEQEYVEKNAGYHGK